MPPIASYQAMDGLNEASLGIAQHGVRERSRSASATYVTQTRSRFYSRPLQ